MSSRPPPPPPPPPPTHTPRYRLGGTTTNVSPSSWTNVTMRHDGAASACAHVLTLLVGREPDLVLESSKLFVPLHDGWRPGEGPATILLEEDYVSGVKFNWRYSKFTEQERDVTVRTIQRHDRNNFNVLNLVLDLHGMEKSEVGECLRGMRSVVSELGRWLNVLKIWFRTSIRTQMKGQKTEIESFDLDMPEVEHFFDVFSLKEGGTYLLCNLKCLWIELQEVPTSQVEVEQGTLWDLPKQFLCEQTQLDEFVCNATHMSIQFPFSGESVKNRFHFKLFSYISPVSLLQDYRQPGYEQWAPYVTMISLKPPNNAQELYDLWPQFWSLAELRIALDSESFTFVQLVHCLGRAERDGLKIRVLIVELMHKIIDPHQVKSYSMPPLRHLEVLSIQKYNFTHHDQVSLYKQTLAYLFPNLQAFFLQIYFTELCSVCEMSTRVCVFKAAIDPLKLCAGLKTWQVILTFGEEYNLRLSEQDHVVMNGQNWFDMKSKKYVDFESSEEGSRGQRANVTSSPSKVDCRTQAEDDSSELTLLVGHEPESLLQESRLFVPMHDWYCPEECQGRMLQPGHHYRVKDGTLATNECQDILKNRIHNREVTKLNLVLDLYGMDQQKVNTTMQQMRVLLKEAARSLKMLRIWLGTCTRFVNSTNLKDKSKKTEADLDLPVMKDFFDVFTMKEGRKYLLNNLERLWIDLHELPEGDFDANDIEHKPWEDEPIDYLRGQTQLTEFVFDSTHRGMSFPPEVAWNRPNPFKFKIFSENCPSKLLEDYSSGKRFAQWASSVTMITLISPYKLNELNDLWVTFESLSHVRISLDKGYITFVQLVASLANGARNLPKGGQHRILEVQTDSSEIITAQQAQEYSHREYLPPCNIELLSIALNYSATNAKVDIPAKLFSRLFPKLRLFNLWLSDKSSYIPQSIFCRTALQQLSSTLSLEAWEIHYWNREKKLMLHSGMSQEVIDREKWFEENLNSIYE